MAGKTTAARQYARLVALWPQDALRPNLPFARAIKHRIPDNDISKPKLKSSPSLEQAQVNALYSLLENRYRKNYPLSPSALKPASTPEYYAMLMQEIERAPQKTWWRAKVDEWKMKIRWS